MAQLLLAAGAGVGATVVTAAATAAATIVANKKEPKLDEDEGTKAASCASPTLISKAVGLMCFMGRPQPSPGRLVELAGIGHPRPFEDDDRPLEVDTMSSSDIEVGHDSYVAAATTRELETKGDIFPSVLAEASGPCIPASVTRQPRSNESSCSGPEALGHGSRGFMLERESGKYLTVVDHAPHALCVLTDKAASLLVCRCFEAAVAGAPVLVAFEHEGLPACGRFLSCKAPKLSWRPASLPLWCAGKGSSGAEVFLRHANSTMQHRPTGLWLWAEAGTGNIILHPTEKSEWDLAPAT